MRTLIHELAHAIVGTVDEKFAYAYVEVIVESATYIAASAAGLDTSGESIPYVAGSVLRRKFRFSFPSGWEWLTPYAG